MYTKSTFSIIDQIYVQHYRLNLHSAFYQIYIQHYYTKTMFRMNISNSPKFSQEISVVSYIIDKT